MNLRKRATMGSPKPQARVYQVEIALQPDAVNLNAGQVTIGLALGRGPRRNKAHARPLGHGLEYGLGAPQDQSYPPVIMSRAAIKSAGRGPIGARGYGNGTRQCLAHGSQLGLTD